MWEEGGEERGVVVDRGGSTGEKKRGEEEEKV